MEKRLIKAGQERPYAPTHNIWEVQSNGESEQEVLDWCLNNCESMERSYSEYERDRCSYDFNTMMSVICRGYYKLTKTGENEWQFETYREYID